MVVFTMSSIVSYGECSSTVARQLSWQLSWQLSLSSTCHVALLCNMVPRVTDLAGPAEPREAEAHA